MTKTKEELREKIDFVVNFVCEGDCDTCRYYNGKPIEKGGEFCTETDKTDQILALFDEEAIRKEERKWVIEELNKRCPHNLGNITCKRDCYICLELIRLGK